MSAVNVIADGAGHGCRPAVEPTGGGPLPKLIICTGGVIRWFISRSGPCLALAPPASIEAKPTWILSHQKLQKVGN